jgi:hypothetical protein
MPEQQGEKMQPSSSLKANMKTMKLPSRHVPMRFGLVITGILAVLVLAGCTTPTALKPQDRAKITQTEVRAYIPQSEVIAEFIQSSYGAGAGVVGAIVDALVTSARAKRANVRVDPLRQVTRDVDLRSMCWQAISNGIPSNSWLRLSTLQMFPTNPCPLTRAELADTAVLKLLTAYLLSEDCRVLTVAGGFEFYQQGKSPNMAAGNYLAYYSAPIGRPERDRAIPLWTTKNAAAFRKAASEGLEETTKLVGYLLQHMGGITNTAARPALVQARLVHGRVDFGIRAGKARLRGHVLEETPDRIIFQDKRGPVYSFPRNEVDIEYTAKRRG